MPMTPVSPAVLAYASPGTAAGRIPAARWLVALHGNALAVALALGLAAWVSGRDRGLLLVLGGNGAIAGVELFVLIPVTVRHVLCAKPSRAGWLLALAAAPVALFLAMLAFVG